LVNSQLPAKNFGPGDGLLVKGPAEPVGCEVGFEESSELGLGHFSWEAAISAAIGGPATTGSLAGILAVELADHLLGDALKLRDAVSAVGRLQSGSGRIMGYDQPMAGEARFWPSHRRRRRARGRSRLARHSAGRKR